MTYVTALYTAINIEKSLKNTFFTYEMGLKLSVDINELVKRRVYHSCSKRNTPYEQASCYIVILTEFLEQYFLANDYEKRGVESSRKRVTHLFSKRKMWAKIITFLIKRPMTALLQVEVERSELAGVEAILKSNDIPKDCVSLVH